MLTDAIHLFFTKTESVSRDGCLQLSSNAATVSQSHPHSHRSAGDSSENEVDVWQSELTNHKRYKGLHRKNKEDTLCT